MSRIVDYTPANEQGIVSRILLAVHKSADNKFPASAQRQFAKTAVAEQNAATSKDNAHKNPFEAEQSPPSNSAFNPSISPSMLKSQFKQFTSNQPMSSVTRDDSQFDFLVSEKQKSGRMFFIMTVMATTAFIALALLLASRNFGF